MRIRDRKSTNEKKKKKNGEKKNRIYKESRTVLIPYVIALKRTSPLITA